MNHDPRYPIGKYEPRPYAEEQQKEWLADIQFLPEAVERAILHLDVPQLQTPYRDGGWTVQQLVHHIADSHLNAYVRFRLGLTEDNPVIKPYDENAWVKLADIETVPIHVSISILHGVHQRMLAAIKDLTPEQWERKVTHPEHGREMTLWFLLGLYAWHGKHHTAHITRLRENKGWS